MPSSGGGISLRLNPAQKARPAPVSTTAPTPSSASQAFSASSSSLTPCPVSALAASGMSNTIRPTPSAISRRRQS